VKKTDCSRSLDARDAYNIARNSFTASFVDEGRKRDWIETLDTAFAAA
jgi:adenosine deaminase